MDQLTSFEKERDFYVGIDSDGCVFDSMEIKHKECFCPAFINHFDLQAAAKYAREVWEFVNLYSRSRGVNRFRAVLSALDLVRERPEVARRGVMPPTVPGLAAWVESESRLGNPALEARIAQAPDPDLQRSLAWSRDVNAAVERIVRNVPPFPGVTDFLSRASEKADLVVVSQTPGEALHREWEEQGIRNRVRLIAGQELGTKADHLAGTVRDRYEKDHVLMIGDAPGDHKAALAVGALFFPIVPGREEASWARLVDEGLDRFFAGTFAGSYAEGLLAEFSTALPDSPPWDRTG